MRTLNGECTYSPKAGMQQRGGQVLSCFGSRFVQHPRISTGRMRRDNAAALVGAAMLSVLIFPLVALALRARAGRDVTRSERLRAPQSGEGGS